MSNTTKIGVEAEDLAVGFLAKVGHKIIARNVRSRFYELDIISTVGEYIVLSEVKYRKNSVYGGGVSAISPDKIKRLSNGFRAWLSENTEFQRYQPRIDVIAVDQSGTVEHLENAID